MSGFAYVKQPEQMKYVLYSNPFSVPPHQRERGYEEAWWDMDAYGNSLAIIHLGYALSQMENREEGFKRIAYLGGVLQERLRKISAISTLSSEAPGMIYCIPKTMSISEAVTTLEQQRILVADKKNVLRISVSPYNSLDDIIHLENALNSLGA